MNNKKVQSISPLLSLKNLILSTFEIQIQTLISEANLIMVHRNHLKQKYIYAEKARDHFIYLLYFLESKSSSIIYVESTDLVYFFQVFRYEYHGFPKRYKISNLGRFWS